MCKDTLGPGVRATKRKTDRSKGGYRTRPISVSLRSVGVSLRRVSGWTLWTNRDGNVIFHTKLREYMTQTTGTSGSTHGRLKEGTHIFVIVQGN